MKTLTHFFSLSFVVLGLLLTGATWTLGQNVDGTLDPSYDPGVYYGPSNGPTITSVGTASDGKAVISGNFASVGGHTTPEVARLNLDGSPDTSFMSGCSTLSGGGRIERLIVQSDGSVVIAGSFTTCGSTSVGRIARLAADGSLDTTFASGTGATGFGGEIRDMQPAPGGKILITGTFTGYNGTTVAGLALLNSDGSLNTVFNSAGGVGYNTVTSDGSGGAIAADGLRITRFDSFGAQVWTKWNAGAPLSDGELGIASLSTLTMQGSKILLGGNIQNNVTSTNEYVVRLNSGGSLDTTFDCGLTNPTGWPGVSVMLVDSNGKIIVGGEFVHGSTGSYTRIARLDLDGAIDTSFDPGTGINTSNTGVSDLAFQPDGKLLAVGYFGTYNGVSRNSIARITRTVQVTGRVLSYYGTALRSKTVRAFATGGSTALDTATTSSFGYFTLDVPEATLDFAVNQSGVYRWVPKVGWDVATSGTNLGDWYSEEY